jgi:hypothetical protein
VRPGPSTGGIAGKGLAEGSGRGRKNLFLKNTAGYVLGGFEKVTERLWFLFGFMIRRGMEAAFEVQEQLYGHRTAPTHKLSSAPNDEDTTNRSDQDVDDATLEAVCEVIEKPQWWWAYTTEAPRYIP